MTIFNRTCHSYLGKVTWNYVHSYVILCWVSLFVFGSGIRKYNTAFILVFYSIVQRVYKSFTNMVWFLSGLKWFVVVMLSIWFGIVFVISSMVWYGLCNVMVWYGLCNIMVWNGLCNIIVWFGLVYIKSLSKSCNQQNSWNKFILDWTLLHI